MTLRYTERTAAVPPPITITGSTVIGIVGTLLGGDAHTDFPQHTPKLVSADFKEKLPVTSADTGRYLGGTMLHALRLWSGLFNNPIVAVNVATASATFPTDAVVVTGVEALTTARRVLQDENKPTLICAPELTAVRTAGTLTPDPSSAAGVSTVFGALETAAETLRGIAVICPPIIATDTSVSAVIARAKAYADAQSPHPRVAQWFGRNGLQVSGQSHYQPNYTRFANFGTSDVPTVPESFDSAPSVIATLVTQDDTSPAGVATNPQLRPVVGGLRPLPVLNVEFGTEMDDGTNLAASRINTFIRRRGWSLYGSLSGASTGNYQFINARRVADRVRELVLDNAAGAFALNITNPAAYTFVIDRVQNALNTMIASEQLVGGSISRSADQGSANEMVFNISLILPAPINRITFNVSA